MIEYGYARVSTLEQDAQLQLDALIAAGVPAGNIYVDQASGTRDDRPALLKVLALVGEGDRLTVWRLDRLGRSLRHLLETVAGLEQRGVSFVSLTENIDTSTPGGKRWWGMIAEE